MILEKNSTFESLSNLAKEGRKVSFTIYRHKPLNIRDAKGYIGGHDPKLTSPLCEVLVSAVGFHIFWMAKSTPPKGWASYMSHRDFEKALDSFKGHLLTIGDLRIS